MAPVEPEAINSNVRPLTFFSLHAGAVIVLISIIARFLAKSSDDLPPAYHTRRRDRRHHWHFIIFSVLTAISFIVTTYHAVIWRLSSYTQWAITKYPTASNTLWSGRYGSAQGVDALHLGRWMTDVDLRTEVDTAIFGTSKALWWACQEQLGIVTWSIFVGIEGALTYTPLKHTISNLTLGRHRNLPTHITLCFILLAQLSGLSTAQNLFFLAISVTHIPMPSSDLLTPHSIVFLLPALWSNIVILYSSVLRTHALWPTISGLTYFIIPLLLAAAAQPNALHKVSKHVDTVAARSSSIPVFRLLSWSAFLMHGYRTFVAIVDNAPAQDREGSYYYYNILFNAVLSSEPRPSLYEQIFTTVAKVFSIVHTDPIVGSVAWDVILSALSLCIWAFTRALPPRTMLECAGVLWTRAELDTVTSSISTTVASATDSVRKRALSVGKRASEITESFRETIASPTKDVANANPRAAAPETPAKRRGRPKKGDAPSKAAAPDAETPAPTRKRRAQKARAPAEEQEGDDDVDYVAPPVTRRQAARLALERDEFDDERQGVEEGEAGALAWALWLLGGLGVGMSSVLGAEVAGR